MCLAETARMVPKRGNMTENQQQPDVSDAETAPEQHPEPKTEPAEKDWKAHAREWEKKAKANSQAAQRLAEIEEAQKTEQQKQHEALQQALTAASQAQIELWRERAARKHGLDDDLMGFLSGESEEEIETKAHTLASKFSSIPKSSGPRPDPTQGQSSTIALNDDNLLSDLKTKLGIH